MIITQTLIRAFASTYSLAQLEQMRAEAMTDLVNNPDQITNVSTGGGASYAQTAKMSAAERIELFQLAIDYKNSVSAQTDIAQFGTPVIWLTRR